MSQPQLFRAAPTRTPSQALANCRIGPADGMEVVLIALDAGAVDFDLNDVAVRCRRPLRSEFCRAFGDLQ